jgi:hypothetical protein
MALNDGINNAGMILFEKDDCPDEMRFTFVKSTSLLLA